MPPTIEYQFVALLVPWGLASPPDSTLPRKAVATGVGSLWSAPISICVIWPIFSSSVIWESSNETR